MFRHPGIIILLAIVTVTITFLGFVVSNRFFQSQSSMTKSGSVMAACTQRIPINAMLIIDRSGSMGQATSGTDSRPRIHHAKRGALKFVAITGNGSNRIGVSSFANTGTLDQELTLQYQRVRNAINNLRQPSQGTCIECGIEKAIAAFNRAPNPQRKKIVVLLSDGKANVFSGQATQLSPAERRALQDAVRSGAIFYTIKTGAGNTNDMLLRLIAQRTGGKMYTASNVSKLEEVYSEIAFEVITQGNRSIRGKVFIDNNKNFGYESAVDTALHNTQVKLLDSNGEVVKTTLANGGGDYVFSDLCDGPFLVSFDAAVFTTYSLMIPQASSYHAYAVGLGRNNRNQPLCSVTPTPASCNAAKNVVNAHFILWPKVSATPIPPEDGDPTDQLSQWIQIHGLDARFEDGVYNPIPTSAVCSPYTMVKSSGTPGVLVTGDRNGNFGEGSVSEYGWKVGGFRYPNVLDDATGQDKTVSYDKFLEKINRADISKINLATICPNLSQCVLPSTLAGGVYYADRSVVLQNFNARSGSRYLFLIAGDLRITGQVSVQRGASVVYAVKGNISVASTIGSAPSCVGTTSQVDGIFVSDKNFIVESRASCPTVLDRQLTMQGAIIVNASGQGGRFINNRTLCNSDNQFPSFIIRERTDTILNLPDILKDQNLIWQEVAP